MGELPSGTVTFLFTDLEVSTRLWEHEPAGMRAALARHDAILKDAVAVHGGQVVKGRGDGLHAVFATADDALGAAIDAQAAIGAQSWNLSEPFRVRIGVHSGVAELRDDDYFGSSVNRAARLQAVANGGQILCSQSTADLVRDSLPQNVELIDLGEHTLRDLSRPERLYQVSAPGLERSFAPLQSVAAFPGNLPLQVTSFVGRREELAELSEVLDESRMVTITGTGGVGKTRVAVQSAAELLERFPDGAWLLELAAVTDAEAMVQLIATTLSVRPLPGVSLEGAVLERLRSKRALVVLDNCEHLLDASGRLAQTMQRAARRSGSRGSACTRCDRYRCPKSRQLTPLRRAMQDGCFASAPNRHALVSLPTPRTRQRSRRYAVVSTAFRSRSSSLLRASSP